MKKIFEKYNIILTDQEEEKLNKYYELLIEWNKRVNLTSITEYQEVIWKHFLDSSFLMLDKEWINKNKGRVIDVGTGAGFPGLVLAVLNPNKNFVLLDSLNKRVDFLNIVISELQLENVETYHGRAETFGKKEAFRNQFDFVISRAVAELPILMEYCIPFTKKGGYFVSYKGKRQEEEIVFAKNAFSELGASFEYSREYSLKDGEKRYLLFIKNNELTNNKYPRKEGKPKKKPL